MSGTSIRVTITRPDLSVEWPFAVFKDDTDTASEEYIKHVTNNESYIIGFEGLTCIVDHHFPNSEDLVTYHDELYAMIPWWQTSSNKDEVAAYIASNGIIVEITEVVDPDHTGFMDITHLAKI